MHSRHTDGLFGGVRTYCMFLGYPRSGSSLVGSLLDAHPDIAIAREANALLFLRAGFSRNQIYHLILEKSSSGVTGAVGKSGYSYSVPNQWQGRFCELRVLGDKKAGVSTMRLREYPWLLQRIREVVGPNVCFVHVVRNPYDNITTISRRSRLPLKRAIEYYFSLCEENIHLKREVGDNMLDVRHEALIEDPKHTLEQLCVFLGVGSPRDYLDDCASIVFPSPHKSRYQIEWNSRSIEVVAQGIDRFSFLAGYSYAD